MCVCVCVCDGVCVLLGHYAYYQSSLSQAVEDYAAITTPKLTLPNSTVCFSFRYHMYGKDVGMLRLDQLIPYLDGNGFESYTTTYLWHASFAFPDHWYLYMKTFKDFTGKVKISARNYYSYAPQGDMAIDNIAIINGTCQDNLGQLLLVIAMTPTETHHLPCVSESLSRYSKEAM